MYKLQLDKLQTTSAEITMGVINKSRWVEIYFPDTQRLFVKSFLVHNVIVL